MIYDVAIVGGGIVGSTLACALGEGGLSVVLIESREPDREPTESLDPRVSAITRGSERILRALNVWPHIPQNRIGTFREMHVWDLPERGEVRFDSAEIAEPSLGYIVENQHLQFALSRRLSALASVTELRPARLRELWINRSRVVLNLDQSSVEARLMVGADGNRSRVRELAGIEVKQGDYGQRAVVSIIVCKQGHQDTAWQRFLNTGPLAVLPLNGDHACVVWSTKPEQAEHLVSISDDAFDEVLNTELGGKLGRLACVGQRQSFPLGWLQTTEYVRERLALVGDAAHTIHPLAGQGVNLGMYDAGVLAQVISQANTRGRDFSKRAVLRRYERWRGGHNLMVHAAMNGFFWLFGSDIPGIKTLRNLGLTATNGMHPVKRLIMRQASGLAGDLPDLARALPESY